MGAGNVAHSIDGEGWVAYRHRSSSAQKVCAQLEGFSGYKTTGAVVNTVINSLKVIAKDMVIVDSGKGIAVNSMGMTGSELETWIMDTVIIAESPVSHDCPSEKWCNFNEPTWTDDRDTPEELHFLKTCIDKAGTYTPMHSEGSKDAVITDSPMLPIEAPASDAVFAGTAYYDNVYFKGFNEEKTYCGGGTFKAITFSTSAADLVPPVVFTDCTFEDTNDMAFIYMHQPPESWTSVRACGSFPCTGPLNTMFTFERTIWVGETGTADERNFQIIPNNEAIAGEFSRECEWVRPWNGYYCNDYFDFGILHFESQDSDAGKRNIYPVFLSPVEDEYGEVVSTENVNKLNQYMEHTCDGIYPGLFRLGRFPALVGLNKFYDIQFTGTVPEKLFFKLQSPKDGIRV